MYSQLYGCEIWGYENTGILESLQKKFYKYILHVKKSTPNYMVFGELGQVSLKIHIKSQMINFWAKLAFGKSTHKYSSTVYRIMRRLYDNNRVKSKWLDSIKQILNETGFSGIWNEYENVNVKWLTENVKQRLRDQFVQEWYGNVQSSDKALTYRLFKTEFKFEEYLVKLPTKYKIAMIKFRMCNHKLPIERGQYRNIPRSDRYCELCNDNKLGDEFHFLLECPILNNLRIQYLPTFCLKNPNVLKLANLLNDRRSSRLINISKYIIESSKLL